MYCIIFLTGDRVVVSPRKGLMCTDSHQSDHACADYKVRFYCPGMRELCHSKNKTHKDITADDITTQRGKSSNKRNKKQENEILKNITKPREKGRHNKPAVPNVNYGAAFHKHLLWNDAQKARRQATQMVYKQWKKNDRHRLSKWRHWKDTK